jgi:hypothetical protein
MSLLASSLFRRLGVQVNDKHGLSDFSGTEGNGFLRVLDPIKTTLGLSAAFQEGFWGWATG